MKCFRVRDAETVENFLTVELLDGAAYVPTGGLHKPYIRASEELFAALGDDRRISSASLLDGSRTTIELMPASEHDAHKALVLIPSSRAYHYRGLDRSMHALQHSNDQLALTVVLEPGQSFSAIRIARTLAESAVLKPFEIGFDGEKLFVRPTSA